MGQLRPGIEGPLADVERIPGARSDLAEVVAAVHADWNRVVDGVATVPFELDRDVIPISGQE